MILRSTDNQLGRIMSATTGAATSNQIVANSASLDSNLKTNIRRRTVAVTEKRSDIEIFSDGGVSGAADDRVVNGTGLSHSLRGETVLERPRDLSQAKRGMINSTIPPRKRKPLPKSEKPRWLTFLSVTTKNLFLVLVLFYLGRLIWQSFEKTEAGSIVSIGASDFERRMSEVESFLKTTAKMMQVQVEVVDRKFEREIGSLKREMSKKVDDKIVALESQLKALGGRADNMDKSLAEIRDVGFFSREDFDKFLNELKNKGLEGSDTEFSLDDIRAYARDVVEKEIEKHAADGLGRVDYALASSGGKVVSHSDPFINIKGSSWFPVGKSHPKVQDTAKKMLEPSFGEPGQCFALKGSNGFFEIKLRVAIIPEAVTLEHVAKSVAYDRSSAPKHCQVSGWLQTYQADSAVMKLPLAEFTYDLDKSSAQTFNVEMADAGLVNMVRLDFVSNHGSPTHTCIYRLRVHGYEPESVTTLPMRSQ